jgi:hypothetical protein
LSLIYFRQLAYEKILKNKDISNTT